MHCAVFILARVAEYKARGYSDRDAVVTAIDKTSGIITAAGALALHCLALQLSSLADD